MWPTRCGKPWTATCSPTTQGAGTGRRGSARGGISPHSWAGPLTHQRPPELGDLPAGRHPGRAPGRLPAPAAAAPIPLPRGRDQPAGDVDPGPARRGCRRRRDRQRSWWRSRRCFGGGVHRTAGRGSGAAGRLRRGAGQWAHLASFPGRPGRVAQDRPGAGAPTSSARRLALLRAPADPPSGYQSPVDPGRRAEVPAGRRAGVDANVSNLLVASFPADTPSSWRLSRSTAHREQQQAPRRGRRNRRVIASVRWIARGVTPTPTSTALGASGSNARAAPRRREV